MNPTVTKSSAVAPITTAFLVCAGLGTRMMPLTATCPKPLLLLNGKPLLSYVFDYLRATSVKNVTVNTHHLPDVMRNYLSTIPDFTVTESYEPILLETGGGLVKALPTLGDQPFFMINGDAFWVEKHGNTLRALEEKFNPATMDILLCLTPVATMRLTEGVGDYDIDADGRLRRNHDKKGTHMFTGIRIVNPHIMTDFPLEKFSFLKNMDAAEAKGRLYGYVMPDDWHHISTPDDLLRVENFLKSDT